MTLPPGYGQTPVDPDELGALLPGTRYLLGEPVTKAAVYDLEQAIQEEVAEGLMVEVISGSLGSSRSSATTSSVTCTAGCTPTSGPGRVSTGGGR